MLVSVGCGTTSQTRADLWPAPDALPDEPPDDLNTEAPAALLRAGSDGFVYVVGMDDDVALGTSFMGRYSGEWPVRDVSRPTLVSGRLVQTYGDGVGLVHLTYTLPDAEADGLEVTWESEPVDDNLGKGRAQITSVAEAPSRDVGLSIGTDHGVRAGDFYALLRDPAADSDSADAEDEAGELEPLDMQLTRRLADVCMVQEVQDESSSCVRWGGSQRHPGIQRAREGDEIVFLEHTFGAAPREGVIHVAAVTDGDESIQSALVAATETYLESVTEPHASVEATDVELDATAADFYDVSDEIEPREGPQMVIGLSVADIDGERRLIGNYTGAGAAAGPGMVAAPPERGVDLGPADSPDADRVESFVATVWSGMLVYRGQTSEALVQLHRMLGDPKLDGPLRWHARDQLAMRWGALGNYRESLWLVLQDERVATQKDDRQAWLNALGTRVRLYDFLDLPARAISTARRYLEAREQDKPGTSWRSAQAMYAEMLMNDERTEDALEVVELLQEACPEGCDGELVSHISGIYWSAPAEETEVRRELLDFIIDHTDDDKPGQVASTRLYQGLYAMGTEDYAQALVAFLEAERLYEKRENLSGQARAAYFAFIAELSRGNPQEAYEKAEKAQELERELNDYRSLAEIYAQMSALYTNPEFLEKPGPYLGAASRVLTNAVESQIAMGDFGGAAESLLGLGGFMLKIGKGAQAQSALTEAIGYAISFQRFDVAALAHLYLGIIAQQQGDMETFQDQIQKAQMMAELSDDPEIKEAIDNALSPDQEEEPPTQLL
ncbi:MAG: tetratricopeptide repeat protein [Persicimonas sp.]